MNETYKAAIIKALKKESGLFATQLATRAISGTALDWQEALSTVWEMSRNGEIVQDKYNRFSL